MGKILYLSQTLLTEAPEGVGGSDKLYTNPHGGTHHFISYTNPNGGTKAYTQAPTNYIPILFNNILHPSTRGCRQGLEAPTSITAKAHPF